MRAGVKTGLVDGSTPEEVVGSRRDLGPGRGRVDFVNRRFTLGGERPLDREWRFAESVACY
jgi:hypothetical protein